MLTTSYRARVTIWYVEAFRKVIGVYPAEYRYEDALDFCPKLLPLYRERVERQTAVVEAYNNFHRLCLKPEDLNRKEARGAGSNKAPAILENMKNVISLCERALAEKNDAERRRPASDDSIDRRLKPRLTPSRPAY